MPRVELSEALTKALYERWRKKYPYDSNRKITQIVKDVIIKFIEKED